MKIIVYSIRAFKLHARAPNTDVPVIQRRIPRAVTPQRYNFFFFRPAYIVFNATICNIDNSTQCALTRTGRTRTDVIVVYNKNTNEKYTVRSSSFGLADRRFIVHNIRRRVARKKRREDAIDFNPMRGQRRTGKHFYLSETCLQ